MFVAYTAKIRGIIECWQCYGVCEDYNGVVSKVLGDGWLNPRILSVQSLEAHHRSPSNSLSLSNTEHTSSSSGRIGILSIASSTKFRSPPM